MKYRGQVAVGNGERTKQEKRKEETRVRRSGLKRRFGIFIILLITDQALSWDAGKVFLLQRTWQRGDVAGLKLLCGG